MLFDDLQQQLKLIEPEIETIITYLKTSDIDHKINKLTTQSEQEDFWHSPKQATVLKELQRLRSQKEQHIDIVNTYTELNGLIELFKNDETELQKIDGDIKRLQKKVISFKINLLLNDPEDSSAAFLSINSGAGGTESQDWAELLLRMYIRFCEREKLPVEIIDYQAGEEAGIKSATLFVKGKNPYGLLKSEQGIHRLVRISPFDASKRRHTSFAAVTVAPETPKVAITIDPNDLRIDTYRAGGAGGQHVNKTDSAVRITHFPSGIVVQCQNERSQAQNKETALKMLKARLAQKQKQELQEKQAAIEKKKIEWGSQIRSYVLHPYKMVKDHRTNTESHQPHLVLDGELMEFIESYLIWRNKE